MAGGSNTLKSKLKSRFIAFLLVGLLNTLFGYSIFALLIFLGLHYALAVVLATCLGIVFNFKTTGVLVFGSHDNLLIGRFIAVYAIMCLANIALIKMTLVVGLSAYAGGAVAVLPVAVAGYLLNSKFVFAGQK